MVVSLYEIDIIGLNSHCYVSGKKRHNNGFLSTTEWVGLKSCVP